MKQLVKFLSESSSSNKGRELIGILDRDLNLKNLENEDLLHRLQDSFKPENDYVIDKTLPDGKSGIFYVSRKKQAYVDCICLHDFNRNRVIVRLRLYRTVFQPKVIAVRYKGYDLHECSMEERKSLPAKEWKSVSNYARNCIKLLSREPDFIHIHTKCLSFKYK